MEKAVESFRQALLYNDRHYNAWYGLGTIYFRQEKFELAECHFRRALSINPASSVLHCYLGRFLHNLLFVFTQYNIFSQSFAPINMLLLSLYVMNVFFSRILFCVTGMALHAQNNTIKTTEALDVLTRAAEKDPSNPQVI